MSYSILVVEDNQEILLNIKIFLECNGYNVYTSTNGKQALDFMKTVSTPPNLIISDIMMPIMNGYDFLQAVSRNPDWNLIPFIFLTAKTSPADVRFAKTLGVDDYITKPFKEEDLLAVIRGKISKGLKYREMSNKIAERILKSLEIKKTPEFKDKKEIILLYVLWDENYGPEVKAYYPSDSVQNYDLQEIGSQLFQTTVSIYGHSKYYESQSVLLRIANIDKDGFLFFDSIDDAEVRGGEKQFMITALAPRINYLVSLRIKEIFQEISDSIKKDYAWEIGSYWERITDILTATN